MIDDDYEMIQAALDGASAGDTIRVAEGTYAGGLRISTPGLALVAC